MPRKRHKPGDRREAATGVRAVSRGQRVAHAVGAICVTGHLLWTLRESKAPRNHASSPSAQNPIAKRVSMTSEPWARMRRRLTIRRRRSEGNLILKGSTEFVFGVWTRKRTRRPSNRSWLGIFRSSLARPCVRYGQLGCAVRKQGRPDCRQGTDLLGPHFWSAFWRRHLHLLFRIRRTLLSAMAAVAFCGYPGWTHLYGSGIGAADPDKANGLAKLAAIPVTIAQAVKADFSVYLNGLGAVEPYHTVLVRSRVDGEVIKIDFKQGQMVKEGDVLVEIDPRPYQAELDQAIAKKAQDEASLKNAELDLARYASLAKEDSVSRQ
jgi:hypothetical protein